MMPDSASLHQTPPSGDLLAWYDRHRRRLPWRALPGRTPDPYRVWLSEIMLQQTTVQTVRAYYENFLARWPTIRDLAAAPADDIMRLWAGLGYYSRARNLHRCAQAVVAEHGGAFPADETKLRALPGIGPYTAAAIAAIAFDLRAVVVDGNVERVVTRLFRLDEPLPAAKPAIRALADRLTPERRPGDFAQAMMDLGATVCTPRKPACGFCPFGPSCAARRAGDQEMFPLKAPKRNRPPRTGATFVAVRADGALLVRRRPAKGLLGGMLETPGTEWLPGASLPETPEGAPLDARWRLVPGTVSHVFTHFPLELVVFRAEMPQRALPPAGLDWLPAAEIAGEAFPTLYRKVLQLALG
jgi:A/G-specific adenine glycosylase